MIRTYTADDLIRVAKRENNQKRSFLYVDPYQGKHIPVSPSEALDVSGCLAERVSETFHGERLLVIGFAETATAIGAMLAYSLESVTAFMTTTRENVPDTDYLYFTESHSHATEQRLALRGLKEQLTGADRVVFAEDEVTTGSTIRKLINALREHFPELPLRFGIASLLNSMTDEALTGFTDDGIPCVWLARIPFGYRIGETEDYDYEPLPTEPEKPHDAAAEVTEIHVSVDQRTATGSAAFRSSCDLFAEEAAGMIDSSRHMNILVLGTEEFMFPGLLLGAELEKHGHTVRYHATTRSPIEVSLHEDYPLHRRFPLKSLYDADRRTFIYDLARYDLAVIVTDAQDISREGLDSLTGSLEACGTDNILLIKWSDIDR